MGMANQITKTRLNFIDKLWWTLLQHRLISTMGDNVLTDRTVLVAGIMEGYKIDAAKILVKNIHNYVVSTNTNLDFPYLLAQICLDEGIPVSRRLINF